MLWCWMDMQGVDSPHGERIVASTLPEHYKRVVMHLRLVSGTSIGVSYAMSFVPFVFLVVLAVVVLAFLVYLLLRRWL
jgi:uncharacterized membrane protein